ncbi:hypothetical protein D3C76_1301030 [compost metagenome]
MDVVALAAQGDNYRTHGVRVLDVATDSAAQQVHRLAGHFHAAADFVHVGHHPVDVREAGQAALIEVVGDLARHGRTAVADHEDTQVVTGGHSTVVADDALERGTLL